MDKHVRSGKIIAPTEVYEELRVGGDELFDWVKARKRTIIRELDEQQIKLAFEIEAKFPNLVDKNKTVADADAFVIALAREVNWKVVTSETHSRNLEKPRIPDVCKYYGTPCLNLQEFFDDLKFQI